MRQEDLPSLCVLNIILAALASVVRKIKCIKHGKIRLKLSLEHDIIVCVEHPVDSVKKNW